MKYRKRAGWGGLGGHEEVGNVKIISGTFGQAIFRSSNMNKICCPEIPKNNFSRFSEK
jgi:hypothetical protein